MCQEHERVGFFEKQWTILKLRYLRWRNDGEPHPTEAEWALDVYEGHTMRIRATLAMYAKGYTFVEIAAMNDVPRQRIRVMVAKGILQSKQKFLTT